MLSKNQKQIQTVAMFVPNFQTCSSNSNDQNSTFVRQQAIARARGERESLEAAWLRNRAEQARPAQRNEGGGEQLLEKSFEASCPYNVICVWGALQTD